MTTPVQIDFDVANQQYGPFSVLDADDLYYRFERTEGSGTLTGTIELRYAMDSDSRVFAESPATTLTLDGTQGEIDIRNKPWLVPVVTTAQSGYKGVLYLYPRRAITIDGGGA